MNETNKIIYSHITRYIHILPITEFLPIKEPHCDAGTINLNVMGGFGTVFGDTRFARS